MSVHAVLLAAGAGRRMGGRPKALLEHGEETYLARAVRGCRQAGCDAVWIVIAPGVPEVAALAASLPGLPVVNPDPGRGMFSSLQCGLTAAFTVTPGPEGFLVHPVDHPSAKAETLATMVERIRAAGPDAWIVPCWEGRGGHPVGLGAGTARALLGAPSDASLREALRSLGARRIDVAVDDPGILANVNEPGDVPDGGRG